MTSTQSPVPSATSTEAALPFHLLGRLPGATWWRPLLVAGTAAGALLGLVLLASVAAVLVLLASGGVPSTELDLNRPGDLALSLGCVIALLPIAMLAVRLAGRRSPGTLLSVASRLRWRLLRRSVAVSLAVLVPVLLVQFGVAAALGQLPEPTLSWPRVALMLAIVVTFTPLQAAAEEVVFRAFLPQLIGGWLRNPLWAYLLPVALFTAGHLYTLPGLVDVAIFGLVASVLTWRSGGIELAIGVHTVGNVLALSLVAFGLADANQSVVPWSAAAISSGCTLVIGFVLWRGLRSGQASS